MQLSSHIRVCKGKPNYPRTLTGIRTVLPRCPDGCIGTLESSWTLKSVWTCFHDVDGCNLELFKASRHWWVSEGYYHIVQTDGSNLWASERFTGTSERKQGIRLFCVGICTKSSWNIEIAFFQLVTLELIIIRLFPYQRNKLWISEDSEIYDIPMKAATLHDSDFVNRM
jgi:hypothetical protein